MCGPWALPLSLAIGGVSGALQYAGAKKAEHAQERAYQAERARQQAFTAEQEGAWRDSLDRAGGMSGADAQAAAVAHREAPLVAAIQPASRADYLPGSSSAAPVVRAASDRAAEGQRAVSADRAHAVANLNGFGDQLFDTSIMNARNAGKIGQIGSFMGGSAAASEAEVRAAAHKGELLRGLGQLAQQIGMAVATGGAGGKPVASGGGFDPNAFISQLYGTPDWRAAGI